MPTTGIYKYIKPHIFFLMEAHEIKTLRKNLGLNQAQFAQLFGVHTMTAWKWEQGDPPGPNAYQVALMQAFQKTVTAKQEDVRKSLKAVLIGAGVVAALLLLLNGSEGK